MPDPTNINEALLVLQADPPVLLKQRTGQAGPAKTKYADLPAVNAQVLTRLNALGVTWMCLPTLQEADSSGPGRFVLRYELLHVASGTSKTGDYPLGAGEPQKMGSAITYARRYALLAVTGIAAEDEDDDGAQGATVARKPRETRPKAEPSTRAKPTAAPALPSDTEPARGPGGLVTPAMTTKLAITMRQALGDDPGTHKQYIVDMIGREVASRKDLTFDEGRGLIDAFEKANQDPDTAAATVIDIYRRTTGGSRSDTVAVASDVAPELTAAIRAGQWKTVQSYADDPGGYGPNIDAAKGALAGAGVQKPATRQPGQRSRNAAEAIGTGDMGNEQAPWETGEMQV